MLTIHDFKDPFVSLTTLSSPHQGLTIFDRQPVKNDVFQEGLIERPLMAVGMSTSNYKEFSKGNMIEFNNYVKEETNLLYYSVGAKQNYK